MWELKKKELERKVVTGNQEVHTTISFDFPDLKKYGEEDRFDLIKKTEIIRDIVSDGVRVPKQVGNYFEYRCKERNCGHSVEVPLDEYAQKPITAPTK